MGYKVGQVVRLSGEFTNADRSALDPTHVNLTIIDPAGTNYKWVYGGGGPTALVQRASAGHYYYDQVLDVAGSWRYRWWSTGTGQTANEKTFDVDVLLTDEA